MICICSAEHLAKCLAALHEQTNAPPFNIVVTCDPRIQGIRCSPDVRVVSNEGQRTPLELASRAMKESTGEMHLHKFNQSPINSRVTSLGSMIQSKDWSSGWTSATFVSHGDNTQLLLLKESSGVMHWHEMNKSGTVGPMLSNQLWGPGWSNAEIYYANGNPYLFLLKDG